MAAPPIGAQPPKGSLEKIPWTGGASRLATKAAPSAAAEMPRVAPTSGGCATARNTALTRGACQGPGACAWPLAHRCPLTRVSVRMDRGPHDAVLPASPTGNEVGVRGPWIHSVKSVLFAQKWLPLRHVPSETDYNGDQTAGQRMDEHKMCYGRLRQG